MSSISNSSFTSEFSDSTSMTAKCHKHLFREVVQTVNIDKSKLLDQILKAVDVSEQIEIFCQTVALNKVDQKNRIIIKNTLQELLCENGLQCEIHFYGSTVSKLGFRDSDIDFYIELNPHSTGSDKQQQQPRYDFNTAMDYLKSIRLTLTKQLNMFVPNPIPSKRCPIIRLDFNNICDDTENNGIVCDLGLSNRMGVHNTKLISFFCDIEPRFRQMSLILRYWAKINGFIGKHEFKSYAFTMLCVFFAQNCSPPLLPTVDYLIKSANQPKILNGWECGFSDDKTLLVMKNEKNTETVAELIANFFKFYSRFDFATQVICPKTGQSVHKEKFLNQSVFNYDDIADTKNKKIFKITPFCCIQDPFDLRHNITAKCRHNAFNKFCELIRYIANNNEKLFPIKQNTSQESYWGIAQLITEFESNSM